MNKCTNKGKCNNLSNKGFQATCNNLGKCFKSSATPIEELANSYHNDMYIALLSEQIGTLSDSEQEIFNNI